jgi:pyruvate-formate lyase-activating enzyme
MYFHSFNVGYIDIPNKITLNIYTVGCEHCCRGCHAEDLQNINHSERKELTSELILSKLNGDFYQGICWLGGDALYQYDEFIKINHELKLAKPDLKIYCFTGYEFEKMSLDKQLDLISCVDILIDGPWKGIPVTDKNSNQKIYIKEKNTYKNITWQELEEINKQKC